MYTYLYVCTSIKCDVRTIRIESYLCSKFFILKCAFLRNRGKNREKFSFKGVFCVNKNVYL